MIAHAVKVTVLGRWVRGNTPMEWEQRREEKIYTDSYKLNFTRHRAYTFLPSSRSRWTCMRVKRGLEVVRMFVRAKDFCIGRICSSDNHRAPEASRNIVFQ